MNKLDRMQLKMRQAMPLEDKIRFTERRVHEWIEEFGVDGVYVSFSGGKDSTVLLDICRKLYPEIKACFVDTGLEYPEIKQFVKAFDNVDIVRPKMMFNKVIEEYGFPIISKEVAEAVFNARKHLQDNTKYQSHYDKLMGVKKNKDGSLSNFNCSKWKFLLDAPFKISHMCCWIMKKTPAHKYYKETGRKPIIATMAEESRLRTTQYLKQGCNGFKNKIPTSTPMAFWTEQDVLEYIDRYKIPYASVYGQLARDNTGKLSFNGCQRTGCMFCGFGCHLESNPNRFEKLKISHPKQYEYIIDILGMGKVLDFLGVEY